MTSNCELPTQTKFNLWYVYVGALVPHLVWITFHKLQAHKLYELTLCLAILPWNKPNTRILPSCSLCPKFRFQGTPH